MLDAFHRIRQRPSLARRAPRGSADHDEARRHPGIYSVGMSEIDPRVDRNALRIAAIPALLGDATSPRAAASLASSGAFGLGYAAAPPRVLRHATGSHGAPLAQLAEQLTLNQ